MIEEYLFFQNYSFFRFTIFSFARDASFLRVNVNIKLEDLRERKREKRMTLLLGHFSASLSSFPSPVQQLKIRNRQIVS